MSGRWVSRKTGSTTAPCRGATHPKALPAPERLRYPARILFAHPPAIRTPLRPGSRRPATPPWPATASPWISENWFPNPFLAATKGWSPATRASSRRARGSPLFVRRAQIAVCSIGAAGKRFATKLDHELAARGWSRRNPAVSQRLTVARPRVRSCGTRTGAAPAWERTRSSRDALSAVPRPRQSGCVAPRGSRPASRQNRASGACRFAANDRVEAVVDDGLDLAPAAGENRNDGGQRRPDDRRHAEAVAAGSECLPSGCKRIGRSGSERTILAALATERTRRSRGPTRSLPPRRGTRYHERRES